MVGIPVSFRDGLFSVAMLVSGSVKFKAKSPIFQKGETELGNHHGFSFKLSNFGGMKMDHFLGRME